jgi:hypothetical protein
MKERQAYLVEMLRHIVAAIRTAKRKRLKLCVRPNGSTDIPYEGLRIFIMPALAAELTKISGHEVTAGAHTIFSAFPKVQFVDYSKNPKRFERELPPNYDLTFSRSETNEADAIKILERGRNVAVVFAGDMPKAWNGYRVINGDEHDLRHLDPKGVVGRINSQGQQGTARHQRIHCEASSMTTYTVTIARSVYETVNVEDTADNEAAAIEQAKQLYSEKTDLPWKSDVADLEFLIYEE